MLRLTDIKTLLLSPTVMSAVLFQVGWFFCIFTPPIAVFVFFVFFLLFHYFYICKQASVWLFSLRLFVIGIAIDSFWLYSSVINLTSDMRVIPYWLLCVWAMFALSVPFGFAFLRKNYFLAAAFGFFGAPISYLSGAAIRDDVMLASPAWISLIFIGISWTLILMLSNFMQDKMKLFAPCVPSLSESSMSK